MVQFCSAPPVHFPTALDNGASIEDVSAFLGHRNIATTAIYLARMEGEDDNGWQGVADALEVA